MWSEDATVAFGSIWVVAPPDYATGGLADRLACQGTLPMVSPATSVCDHRRPVEVFRQMKIFVIRGNGEVIQPTVSALQTACPTQINSNFIARGMHTDQLGRGPSTVAEVGRSSNCRDQVF
jgi:hypothetical protein